MKKEPVHYVDNKKLYNNLVEYENKKKEMHPDLPPIPEYIGECIIKIAKNLASRGNFVNYTYKDEMIADSIENCLQAVDSFDSSKSTNAFGYFSRIIWFAFLRRIQKEKKQHYLKLKNYQTAIVSEQLLVDSSIIHTPQNEAMDEFIKNFEETAEKKKQKILEKQKGVDKFIEEDDVETNITSDGSKLD